MREIETAGSHSQRSQSHEMCSLWTAHALCSAPTRRARGGHGYDLYAGGRVPRTCTLQVAAAASHPVATCRTSATRHGTRSTTPTWLTRPFPICGRSHTACRQLGSQGALHMPIGAAAASPLERRTNNRQRVRAAHAAFAAGYAQAALPALAAGFLTICLATE